MEDFDSYIDRKLKPEAKKILSKATESGFITLSELKRIVPDAMFSNGNSGEIERLKSRLADLGIKIVASKLERRIKAVKFSEDAAEELEFAEIEESGEEIGDEESEIENNLGYPKTFDHLSIFYREMNSFSFLTAKEEWDLSKVAISTRAPEIMRNDARNKLVLHNLRLAVKIAWRNLTRAKMLGCSMDLGDLISEGILGVIRAAEQFDYRMNFRFSTYAIWWIRQYIQRAILNQARIVRIPIHKEERWRKTMRSISRFIQLTGREPEPYEISEELKISESEVRENIRQMRLTVGYWKKMFELDAKRRAGDDRDSHEIVESDRFLSPESAAIARSELEFAEKRLAKIMTLARKVLKNRDFEVFRTFYGIEDNSFKRKTLEETGKKFSVTRERIRQIIEQRVWMRLKLSGLKVGEEWFKKEINRILLLENLAGRRAFSVTSPRT